VIAALASVWLGCVAQAGGAALPLCPSDSVQGGWRVVEGEAKGQAGGHLIPLAREDAYDNVEARCGKLDLDAQQCGLLVAQYTYNYGDGDQKPVNARKDSACASVRYKAEMPMILRSAEGQAWGQAVQDLAGRLRELAGDDPIRLGATRQANGCTATWAGRILWNVLAVHLTGLAEVDSLDERAVDVSFEFTPQDGRHLVNVRIRRPGSRHHENFGALTMTHDAFPDLNRPDLCFTNKAVGVTSAPAADTLGVSLDLNARSGSLCEGEPIKPTIDVTDAARIVVFDVDPDGTARRIWPAGTAGDEVAKRRVLEKMHPAPDQGDQTNQVVVVAVPADAPPWEGETWGGYCEVPGVWSPARLPPGAAVAAASYTVRAADACGGTPTPRASLAAATIPPCTAP